MCISALLVVASACGDSAASSETTTAAAVTTIVLAKPVVSLPAATPTALKITDLVTGTGPAAAVGDVVIVHYVGVRGADGQEFDNSYDRGEPIDVLLGAGRVIPGWEQGLIGVQLGGRRQLDIPAALAYGASPPAGGPIVAGDALTFVVDVVAVLPTPTAADQPDITVAAGANIAVLKSTDLIVGEGATPKDGQNVAVNIISYRADTGEMLNTTWGSPPVKFSYSAQTEVFPGLLAAVKGMQVGGRRQAQVPFQLVFDGQGSADLGLPAGVDMVFVIDLVVIY